MPAQPSLCRGCQAPIRFIRNPVTGRFIPCEYTETTSNKLGIGDLIVTGAGIMKVSELRKDDLDMTGYVPHWSKCSNPGRFRKERK